MRGGFQNVEVSPIISDETKATANMDGNTVNLDRELSRLAKNSIMFNASAQILSQKLKMLRFAIQSGRG